MFVVGRPLHVLVARSEINSAQRLRGKSVSIGAYNDFTDFVLCAILARHNMDREKGHQKFGISGSALAFDRAPHRSYPGSDTAPPFLIEAEKETFKRLAPGADVYQTELRFEHSNRQNEGEPGSENDSWINQSHLFLKSNKAESIRLNFRLLKIDSLMASVLMTCT